MTIDPLHQHWSVLYMMIHDLASHMGKGACIRDILVYRTLAALSLYSNVHIYEHAGR